MITEESKPNIQEEFSIYRFFALLNKKDIKIKLKKK